MKLPPNDKRPLTGPCPSCGEAVLPTFAFCPACGSQLPRNGSAPPPDGPPAVTLLAGDGDERGFQDLGRGRGREVERRSPAGEIDRQLYHRHLRDLCRWIHHYAAQFSFGNIRVDPSHLLNSPLHQLPGARQIAQFLVEGTTEGMIHEEQVHTAFEILHELIHNKNNVTCFGATQCGKTGTSNVLWLVGLLSYLVGDDKKTRIVLLIPPYRSIRDQANDEFERFVALYGDLDWIQGDRSASLRSFIDGVHRHGVTHCRNESECWDVGVCRIMRTRGRAAKQVQKLIEEAQREGYRLILILDEAHWGAGITCQLDHLLKAIKKQLRAANESFHFAGFSATAWVLTKVTKVVRHRLGPGYRGWNYCNGDYLDPRYPDLTPPEVRRFRTFFEQTGIPIHAVKKKFFHSQSQRGPDSVFRSAYRKNLRRRTKGRAVEEWFELYTRWCAGRELPARSWDSYRQFCEQTVADFLNRLFQDDPKRDAYRQIALDHPELRYNPDHGLAACVRFVTNNREMDRLIERLRPRLAPTIQLLGYMGQKTGTSVKAFLKE